MSTLSYVVIENDKNL